MSQQSTTRRRRIGYLTAAGAGAAVLATTGALIVTPASAATSPTTTTTTRSCGSAVVSLHLQHSDPGRIDVGFEIDHAKVNSIWRVHLTHNGATYFLARRTAAAPDGTLSVDRVLPNLSGIDTVSATARNLATGQLCTISARI